MRTKTLTGVAIPAFGFAIALGAALPAAAQSHVTIYGAIDASLRIDRASNATVRGVQSGLSTGSRIGFKGSEDLGGGMKAMFQLESGLNLDDGTADSAFWGRQAFVAIGGHRTGMLSLGRQYTPIFALSAGALDPFSANYMGSALLTRNAQGGDQAKASNSIGYSYNFENAFDSPMPRDRFSFAAMFAPGEAADGSRAGDFGSAAIGYGSGPWFAGYAFSITRGSAAATPPSTTPKQTSHLAGMTYKIGPAMLFGALNTTRNDASGPAYVHRTGWSLGMRWAVPVGQVIGQYQRSNDSTSADADFSSVALAYLYPLSRRTMLYVNAAHNTNSDNAKFAIPKTQAGAVIDPGYNPSSLAFGIRLFF